LVFLSYIEKIIAFLSRSMTNRISRYRFFLRDVCHDLSIRLCTWMHSECN